MIKESLCIKASDEGNLMNPKNSSPINPVHLIHVSSFLSSVLSFFDRWNFIVFCHNMPFLIETLLGTKASRIFWFYDEGINCWGQQLLYIYICVMMIVPKKKGEVELNIKRYLDIWILIVSFSRELFRLYSKQLITYICIYISAYLTIIGRTQTKHFPIT